MLRPTRAELKDLFEEAGIDHSRPGFCDSPEFIAAEQRIPDLMNFYGLYVTSLSHPPEYLTRARSIIRQAAEFLSSRLAKDGRQGACVDVTHTLARFLNRLNIWNVPFNGALTITFPPTTGITPAFLQPLGAPGGSAGHLWLYAAPFAVADLSVRQQPYESGERAHIPDYVLEENLAPAAPVEAHDLLDGDLQHDFLLRYRRSVTMDDLEVLAPGLRDALARWRMGVVRRSGVELKYIPWKVSSMDGSLEEMRNLRLNGKYPAELYREFEASLMMAP